MLLDKLAFTENKYEELSVKISDPSIMANQKEWRKLCKEHADLEIIVTAYREYKKVRNEDDPLYENYQLDCPIVARMLSNGDIAIGIFNFRDNETRIDATMDSLGLGECTGKTIEMTDVWTGETVRPVNATIQQRVAPHACKVYRAKVVDL